QPRRNPGHTEIPWGRRAGCRRTRSGAYGPPHQPRTGRDVHEIHLARLDQGSDMYVRWFLSAVDPADVDDVRRIFEEDVRPVFKGIEGCSSIELVVNKEMNAGGLVEGAALSRWD